MRLHEKLTLAWFGKAVAFGVSSTAPVGWVLGFRGFPLVQFALVGLVFSVVMWGGGVALGDWIFQPGGRTPVQFALLTQARWFAVYTVLLALCVVAIRLVFGLNLAPSVRGAAFVAVVGFLISSLVLSFQSMALVAQHAQDLERARAQAGFLALRAQLSPHTLFNGLNTVAALIPENPGKAEAVVEGLSRLLRRILDALERDTWTLAQEFDLLRDLLDLERARFGDRLTATLDLPEAGREQPVPPLLLLPLVENSLKHGFRPKVGPCRLEVVADGSRVVVRDDGVGRTPGAPEGVGLRTVRQRLEAQGGSLRWLETRSGAAVEVVLCP